MVQAHWDSNCIQLILWKLPVNSFNYLLHCLYQNIEDECWDGSNPNVNFLFLPLLKFLSYFICVLNTNAQIILVVKLVDIIGLSYLESNKASPLGFPRWVTRTSHFLQDCLTSSSSKDKISRMASSLGHKDLTKSTEFDTRYLSFLNSVNSLEALRGKTPQVNSERAFF